MALFENILLLMLVAILALQFSRGLAIPYPAVLAAAGVAVAALPSVPLVAIDPALALALFIAPALLDSAYDLPPRELRRHWAPLLALAVAAVLLSAGAVAWLGMAWGGLPAVAALALGAVVAPPDAAAASAMLGRLALPRSTVTVLKGESLFNDAAALLLLAAALELAAVPGEGTATLLLHLAPAVPGGLVFGWGAARLYLLLAHRLKGTLGGILFQFVGTFGTWIIAERLHLSAILAVVAYGMTIAHTAPYRTGARERVHAYSVWESAVFLLNVLAFFLLGLQARDILQRLDPAPLREALVLAGLVLLVVILVRLAWVLAYGVLARWLAARGWLAEAPGWRQSLVAGWCGMRGLVTLAAALALPADFPGRDPIVISALAVVLGTLVLQGLTLVPLVRALGFDGDDGVAAELALARTALLDAALRALPAEGEAADSLRAEYRAARAVAASGRNPRAVRDVDALKRAGIAAKRDALAGLRRSGAISDDVFHALEQELDWAELAATPADRQAILEG
ncbi:cation:proton antiporter [Roseomonas sp. 18066]|uniref:cation:proton antiporter domain-containing protein n=1 Tax=Roseomonas sp. 18066 TaxID=2681412 RepID=UPI00135BB9FA|nr:cation:proton antiporter [Roseomonas sp. 18066]